MARQQAAAVSPIAYQYGPDQYSSVLAVGWTQTLGFNNVTITGQFGVGGVPGSAANAFLTTSIGPGTTLADQVATTTFAFPQIFTGTPYPDVTLFTGLTLTPGSYYLTVIGTPGSSGGWGNASPAVVASDDPGATVSGFYALSNDGRPNTGKDPAPYAPASAFNGPYGSGVIVSVTGNVVPELSSFALFGIGLGLTLLSRRQRETR